MRVLFKKLHKLFREIMLYALALLLFVLCMLVPLTIIAWCIQFWVLLF